MTGELTFATARDARQLGVLVLEARAPSASGHRLRRCHARRQRGALPVLLDWLAWGRRKSRAISLAESAGRRCVAIARISEVDGLLHRGSG